MNVSAQQNNRERKISLDGISTGIFMLLIKGIPEGFLNVLALHLFTHIKIDIKKYIILSVIFVVATFFIRLLPITLGVNTVLSLLITIITFQIAYKSQLSKVVSTIVSAIVIAILVALSEVMNMLVLTLAHGSEKAAEMFNSADNLMKSVYTIPSTVFFAIFIVLGYIVIKAYNKRKKTHGEISKSSGE